MPVNTVIVRSRSTRTHRSSEGFAASAAGRPLTRRSRAARSTAWMIRQCDPQRQRCGSSAARISLPGRLGGALEQRDGPDHHPGDAVPALRRLLLDERTLHGVQPPLLREALNGDDLAPDERLDGGRAGRRGDAVDEHGAGVALLEPAAELCRLQAEIVTQREQQWRLRVAVDSLPPAVDVELDHRSIVRSLTSADRR